MCDITSTSDRTRNSEVARAVDLCAGYNGVALVSGVNVTIRPRQIVTLVGPNGAGKSTILKTLAGQLEPLGGVVYLGKRDLASMSPQEQALERSVLLTERLRTELLSCKDVVETGRYPHTGRLGTLRKRDHEAVREAMELVGVWNLRGRDFAELSDGQRQRVMLARAICQDPRVLVLDEPTSYLDIRHKITFIEVLRQLVRTREVGIVMTLHELGLARQASDWLVCVKNGTVTAQGTPNQIVTPSIVNELYDLQPGTYDALTGTITLPSQQPSNGTDGTREATCDA